MSQDKTIDTSTLLQAVEDNPESAKAHLKLGTFLLQTSALNAEKHLRKAIELDSNCAEAWVNLGGIFMARWDFDSCVDANKQALDCKPNFFMAHYNMGLGYLYLGKASDMVNCFTQALEIDAEHGGANYYMAVGLLAQGKAEEAKLRCAVAMQLGFKPEIDFIKELEKKVPSGINIMEFGPDLPKPPKPDNEEPQGQA